jgi:hypothetical protein
MNLTRGLDAGLVTDYYCSRFVAHFSRAKVEFRNRPMNAYV